MILQTWHNDCSTESFSKNGLSSFRNDYYRISYSTAKVKLDHKYCCHYLNFKKKDLSKSRSYSKKKMFSSRSSK